MNKRFSVVLSVLMAAVLTGCFNETDNTTVTEIITVPETVATTETSIRFVSTPEVEDIEVDYSNNVSEASIYGPGGFSIPTDGECFSNEELLELAKKRYSAIVGRLTEFIEIDRVSGDIVYIRFYERYYENGLEMTYTEDMYKVDRKTGVGTDEHGQMIDLTAFI